MHAQSGLEAAFEFLAGLGVAAVVGLFGFVLKVTADIAVLKKRATDIENDVNGVANMVRKTKPTERKAA